MTQKKNLTLAPRRTVFGTSLSAAILFVLALPIIARAGDSYESWRQIYNQALSAGATEDATAIAMDRRGNVAVTGFKFLGDNLDNSTIFYTVKYDGLDGHIIWQQPYNGGFGNNVPNAVTCDSVGNVIVTGGVMNSGGNLDVFTIKYAAADGAIIWTRTYNGPADGEDQGLKVVVDSNDNVIVTAKSVGSSTGYDFYTIKYAAAFPGTSLWTGTRFNGAGNQDDVPTALAVDSNNDVLVAGSIHDVNHDQNFYTAKYSAAAGAVTWSKTYKGVGDSGVTALAVSSTNDVVVTGFSGNSDNTNSFFTRSYSSGGSTNWSATYTSPGENFGYGPVGVVIDSVGNVIVTGTSTDSDIFDSTFYYTVKYEGTGPFGGLELWHQVSPTPDHVDIAKAIVIDGSDDVIVTGASQNPTEHDTDYDTFKYSGSNGSMIWERRYTGVDRDGTFSDANPNPAPDNFSCNNNDVPVGLAVDGLGGVAVTGRSLLQYLTPNAANTRIATLKYNSFQAETGDLAVGTGLSATAKLGPLFTPAIGDTSPSNYRAPGQTPIAARVTVASGRTKLGGIFTAGSGGGAFLPAVQKGQSPDGAGNATTGLYKSFGEPLVAPDGTYSFSAKLSGPHGTPASGIFTNTFSGDAIQLALAAGADLHATVSDLPVGTKILSVTSMSMRNGELVALVKVTGATKGTVLVSITSPTTGKLLLKTGQTLTVGASDSTIKKFSVLNPAMGSPDDGRWEGNGRVVAKVTLADKREVFLAVTTSTAAYAPLLYTGQDASSAVPGTTWKSLGLPGVGGSGFCFASMGTLEPKAGVVAPGNDTVLVFSVLGSGFATFAREGDVAPSPGNTDTATYASFHDPLVNNAGTVAFVGTLKGHGVTGKNKTALWSQAFGSSTTRIARLGDPAPVPFDDPESTAEFSSFVSTALPDGTGAGPVFLAKLSGRGVSSKNNLGLFAVDSTGQLRQLLRTGEIFDSGEADTSTEKSSDVPAPFRVISKMTLLGAARGDFGATRSFNGTGAVSVLLRFKDKTEALLDVGIP